MSVFRTVATDGKARAGVLITPHGEIETPIFMPVGTQGSVKSLTPDDLKNIGAQIILGNTYHLYLRPGEKLIKKFGGLHRFTGWDRPMLTDSGGFQVMSLGDRRKAGPASSHSVILNGMSEGSLVNTSQNKSGDSSASYRNDKNRSPLAASESMVKIDEDGVTFQSHLDGSKHKFTPEKSIQIQHDLGADIIMAFDEVAADKLGKEHLEKAMEKTNRWAKRSLDEHKRQLLLRKQKRSLFGIIQGGNHKDLRKKSAEFITSLDFDGIALGGETIGFDNKGTKEIMEWLGDILPKDKPHYAMGVGEVETIFYVVEGGVDMFDCVSPTRRARNGSLYVSPKNGGKIANKFALTITNAQFKEDKKPINPGCLCYTCQNFSRAYLRHLYLAQELLYHHLATLHNVYFILNLTRQIRAAIIEKRFNALKKSWLH